MPLDQNQIDRIQRHMNNCSVRNQCHACGSNNFSIGEMVASPGFSAHGVSIGGQTIPMVQVVCNRCGYVMHFAAKVVGLIS